MTREPCSTFCSIIRQQYKYWAGYLNLSGYLNFTRLILLWNPSILNCFLQIVCLSWKESFIVNLRKEQIWRIIVTCTYTILNVFWMLYYIYCVCSQMLAQACIYVRWHRCWSQRITCQSQFLSFYHVDLEDWTLIILLQ